MADKIRKGAEKTKEVATSVGETLKNMGGEGETRRAKSVGDGSFIDGGN